MRIVLDAMGGDHAPSVVVQGAILAAREYGVAIALVGPEDTVAAELAGHEHAGLPISVVHADEVVGMEEHAATALRQKRSSSIAVGVSMVRDGQAAAFVSAGTSAAVLASASLRHRQDRRNRAARPGHDLPYHPRAAASSLTSAPTSTAGRSTWRSSPSWALPTPSGFSAFDSPRRSSE